MDQTIALMGMVISAQPIGEHDKRVVILTRELGKISAFARGARRQNSPLLAGTNPFAFGQFHVYEGRSSYTLVQTEISNYFRELAGDVEGACYGFYFLELAEYYSQENAEALEMLRLLYQTFRALMKPALDRALIRRIFELKMLVINGEYPDMFHCCLCHKEQNLVMYSAVRGGRGMPYLRAEGSRRHHHRGLHSVYHAVYHLFPHRKAVYVSGDRTGAGRAFHGHEPAL